MDELPPPQYPSLVTTGLIVVSTLFPVLSAIAIGFGIAARRKGSILVWVYAARSGVNYYNVDFLTGTEACLELVFISSCYVQFPLAAVKISVLLFYKRIFTTPMFRACVWISIGVITLWAIIIFLLVLLEIDPVAFPLTEAALRLNSTALGLAHVISSFTLDIIVLCLPLPVISRLNMQSKRKLAVAMIFWLGAFCAVAAIVRTALLDESIRSVVSSASYDHSKQYIFMVLEPNCSIVAACLPTYGPLIAGGRAPESMARSVLSVLSLFSLRSRGSGGSSGTRRNRSGLGPNVPRSSDPASESHGRAPRHGKLCRARASGRSSSRATLVTRRTPLVPDMDPYALRATETHACFAMQALQPQPLDIFPRKATGKDKYVFIIPLALTVCAALHGCHISLSVMYEMMVLSILNFYADEYMESHVERHFGDRLDDIRSLVREIFVDIRSSGAQVGVASECEVKCEPPSQGQPSTEATRAVLHRFVTHVLRHPAVLSSPVGLQNRLAFELQTFLLVHITQAHDKRRLRMRWRVNGANGANGANGLSAEGNSVSTTKQSLHEQYKVLPERTFYHWVRSTSADHTSCPFSFIFFNCLIHAASSQTTPPGGHNDTILNSARTAYLAEDACRHLASLCRMYNDLGSVARDADERTLNSVNFPEFSLLAAGTAATPTTRDGAKTQLMWIAEYERHGLDTAMELLEQELGCWWSDV